MSDSLMIEATGEGIDRLTSVLMLCTDWKDETPSWRSWGKTGSALTVSKFEREDGVEFPSAVDPVQLALLAQKYIDDLKPDQWPSKPDIDGSLYPGWKVTHNWEGTKIMPFWMVYHK